MTTRGVRTRPGFSLIEVIFAMLLLALGMMAVASGSGYATTEVRAAAMRTQRSAAVQSMIETIRARAFNSGAFDTLRLVSSAAPVAVGSYTVWYDTVSDTASSTTNTKRFLIFRRGPAYRPRVGWSATATDTTVFVLYRPFP